MKKKFLSVGVILLVASSITFTSCIGSFALTNKVLSWNQQVGNKFVNELVFFAFWVIPVYELTCAADVLVINTIEFWSGSNPVTASTQVIDGKDARYLVQRDNSGYTITNLKDKSVSKFVFDASDNSWAYEQNGQSHKMMKFVDDTHVQMITPEGDFKTVELSQQGVMAYQELATAKQYAMK